jgi:Fe-S-cluster-containing hydrogenase component 2
MKTKKYKCDVCGKYYEKPMVVTECANCYLKGWKKEFKKKLKEQKEIKGARKMNKKQEEFNLSEKIEGKSE